MIAKPRMKAGYYTKHTDIHNAAIASRDASIVAWCKKREVELNAQAHPSSSQALRDQVTGAVSELRYLCRELEAK